MNKRRKFLVRKKIFLLRVSKPTQLQLEVIVQEIKKNMSNIFTFLKIKKNGILYTIRVENFRGKLKWTQPGKSIDSRTFSIGEAKFRIKIIPKKRSLDKSMRIFLRNESAWVVRSPVS